MDPGTGSRWLRVAIAALMLAGCGVREIYRDEPFRADTPFSRKMPAPAAAVCDAARRALLSQGYALDKPAEPGALAGVKYFQRDEENSVALRLQVQCVDDADGSSTVFAGAQQEVNQLQTLKQPLSINVGPIGGITLPAGSSRVPVTVKRETIQDADFYARFYRLVEELLRRSRHSG